MFWEVHRPVPICGQLIFPQSHYLITPCYFVNFTRSQKKSCYKHYQSTLINKSLKTYQTNPIDSFNCFSMSRQTVKFRLHVTEKTSTLYLYPPTCKKMFNCFTCSVLNELCKKKLLIVTSFERIYSQNLSLQRAIYTWQSAPTVFKHSNWNTQCRQHVL